MNDALREVDLAFVVDTTGSMGAFIGAAKRQMTDMLRALVGSAAVRPDLRLAVVEYRDHPPQDTSFVARAHGFEPDLARAAKAIDRLAPGGGGDAPEAVYDGLDAACKRLAWRPHAYRLAVLVGDAPPHGTGFGGDAFPKGCPCKLTSDSVTAVLEGNAITLYAIGLTQAARPSFTTLAAYTGGEYFEAAQGEATIDALKGLLGRQFEGLELDGQVLDLSRRTSEWTVDGLSETLSVGRNRIAGSLCRLARRGFLAATK